MKSLLKFITCGSVDDGKSTLIGHILYNAKLIYADQKKALELDSKVGSRDGNIDYSLLLDGLMAEREQGITIDVAYRYFNTDNRSFIVADTPGHEEYTRNMAVGASFAELAIILVDASQGVLVQTRRHARICALMGIKYFIFAINKMDLVNYSEEKFIEIREQLKKLKDELSLQNVKVIPISATEGDNVTKKSDNMKWYKHEDILSYLENINIEELNSEKGFYMPVQRVCRPNHTFRGFQGQVESGIIKIGDEITALPSNEKARVKSINVDEKSISKGQAANIQLDREVDVSRGCVLIKDADIKTSDLITSTILWMDDERLAIGKEFLVKVGTKTILGIVKEIKYKIDINSGEHLSAGTLSKNEIAVCSIQLSEDIIVSEFNRYKTLGEFILIDRVSNMTAACGTIQKVFYEHEKDNGNVTFRYKDLEARGDIFDEFYYDSDSLSIYKYNNNKKVYTVGDKISIRGNGYTYPENFDILLLRDNISIMVKNGVISQISVLQNYKYSGKPLVNGRGFSLNAHSEDELNILLRDYKELKSAEFLKKWADFTKYRNIVFGIN